MPLGRPELAGAGWSLQRPGKNGERSPLACCWELEKWGPSTDIQSDPGRITVDGQPASVSSNGLFTHHCACHESGCWDTSEQGIVPNLMEFLVNSG